MTDPTPTLSSTSEDAAVDISPISPADRRNSLEKHLQTRPEEQDLKNRHILLDTNAAPALQAKQLELERQRATDNLKKGLGKRPERGELVDRELFLLFLLVLLFICSSSLTSNVFLKKSVASCFNLTSCRIRRQSKPQPRMFTYVHWQHRHALGNPLT